MGCSGEEKRKKVAQTDASVKKGKAPKREVWPRGSRASAEGTFPGRNDPCHVFFKAP